MVLHTEYSYPGVRYQQETYSVYQGPEGYIPDSRYSNNPGVTTVHANPNSTYPQVSTYQSGNPQHHQSGWSTGGGYPGKGGSHYPGGDIVAPVGPNTGGYGGSYQGGSYGHGSPQGHGNPHGHGSPHGHLGGGGHNGYGSGGATYPHSSSGYNYGYPPRTWTLKGLDDE